jgi:integrase
MPRQGRGPHLWLNPERNTWYIKDGRERQGTGCHKSDRAGAEQKLAEYTAGKELKRNTSGKRAPSQILVAHVIGLYLTEVAPERAREHEIKKRLGTVNEFFGKFYLSELTDDLYKAYAKFRGDGAGRRELEDLRAAINYHRGKNLCDALIAVKLPSKGQARQAFLTREDAAKLIWHCWRYREIQHGKPTGKYSRKHIARFIVAAIYTTRRKGALLETALERAPDRPWIDLRVGALWGKPLPEGHKKRQPNVPLPSRLLGHIRRWAKNGARHLVEFHQGEEVGSIDKGFANACRDAGIDPEICVHSLRHTGITWLATEGRATVYQICRYAGITEDVFWNVYAHFNARYMQEIMDGFSRHREQKGSRDHYRDYNAVNKPGQTSQGVANIADFSRKAG